jgi:hypothetical protein
MRIGIKPERNGKNMGKYIRVLIAILVVLSIVLLARDQVAKAQPDTSLHAKDQGSVLLHRDECGKDKDKKDRDKDKCKDKDGPHGSVLPPDDDIEVCQRGSYSVGGVATLDIKNLRGEGCLTAHTSSPTDVTPLPVASGTALSDVIALTLPTRGAILKICFAVPPGEQARIYSSSSGSWRAVRTQVKNGIACAEVKNSGNYTLVGQ